MFNISDDSKDFKDKNQLEGLEKENNIYFDKESNTKFLLIYESKLIFQYDHRFAEFKDCSIDDINQGNPKKISYTQKNVNYYITPRYWIEEKKFKNKKVNWNWDNDWFLAIRLITRGTDSRTSICSIIPNYPSVNSLNLLLGITAIEAVYLISNINSIVFDYVSRQKISGANLNQFILEQLPIVDFKKWQNYEHFIIPKVLELIYTSEELKIFANECGYEGDVYKWDEERRLIIKAELDAIVTLLFKLSRKDLAYIIDSFKVLKKNELKEFNEFKTKRLILKAYDEFSKIIII